MGGYKLINKYFVASDRSDEIEVIKQLKPERILINYSQFKNKSVLEFASKLCYNPKILIDPGSYGVYKRNEEIDLVSYMNFIFKNLPYLNGYDYNPYKNPFPLVVEYLALDVIGDPEETLANYEYMLECNYSQAIPVFHYGSDIKYLDRYIELGAERIALGGTVKIKNDREVIRWVKSIVYKYQNVYFHLLGNTNPKILEKCKKIDSCDSSTWILNASYGRPKHIQGTDRGAKVKRAYWNLRQEIYRAYF